MQAHKLGICLLGLSFALGCGGQAHVVQKGSVKRIAPFTDYNKLRDMYSKDEKPLLIIGSNIYSIADVCLGSRYLGGDSESRQLGGDKEKRNLGGDQEQRTIGGGLEERSIGGDQEERKIGGDKEERTIGGDLEERKIGGMQEEFTCTPNANGNGFVVSTRNNTEVKIFDGQDVRWIMDGKVEF